MQIEKIPVPEVYKESADFRFFLKWFSKCLSQIQYDIENTLDCYDPLRCKKDLLWLLGNTMGYKYDNRLIAAFNRLVLIYFMSMIRSRGSKDGMMLAAEVNLAQFNLNNKANSDGILEDRLEDTSIPVNSAYVTAHPDDGYIDVVYFSTELPVDACIEYVRPIGMYCFQHPGVRFSANTKISVDAKLTDSENISSKIGPTRIGHYSRNDYARMQRSADDSRQLGWQRNSKVEDRNVNMGLRSLHSLQLANNDEVVKSLLGDKIFSIGFGPDNVDVTYSDDYLKYPYQDKYSDDSIVSNKPWNLRYDKALEESISTDVSTVDSGTIIAPVPAVNPVMGKIGDAISMNTDNTKYTKIDENGKIKVE